MILVLFEIKSMKCGITMLLECLFDACSAFIKIHKFGFDKYLWVSIWIAFVMMCECNNSYYTGWIGFKFGIHISSDSALSRLTF